MPANVTPPAGIGEPLPKSKMTVLLPPFPSIVNGVSPTLIVGRPARATAGPLAPRLSVNMSSPAVPTIVMAVAFEIAIVVSELYVIALSPDVKIPVAVIVTARPSASRFSVFTPAPLSTVNGVVGDALKLNTSSSGPPRIPAPKGASIAAPGTVALAPTPGHALP